MKIFLINLILLISLSSVLGLIVTELDSDFILGLFRKDANGFKVVNLDPKVTITSSQKDTVTTIKSFFEEQCAIECLKNILCVQYAFDEAKQSCSIYLRPNFERQVNVANNQKIKENIKCDLQKCSKGMYCSPDSNNLDGTCLCNSVLNSGDDCSTKLSYEISEWSKWSDCSTSCGEGFSSRSRTCSKGSVKVSDSLNWLCDKNQTTSIKNQIEKCKIKECTTYTEWSSWSSCSKICGGTRTRRRTCEIDKTNKMCDEKYLVETQYCSFLDDCPSSIIKLVNTDRNPGNITKRGFLKLYNPLTLTETRLFSTTNDLSVVENIGKVACAEFGFTKSLYTDPIKVDNLKSTYTKDRDYLKFVNEQSVNGLRCLGNETSIKDCSFTSNADVDTILYELEVECQYNGYYSVWSAWPPCSVTCGAGARSRTRVCNDPPPSISETNRGNGSECVGMALHLENCVMPRCKTHSNKAYAPHRLH